MNKSIAFWFLVGWTLLNLLQGYFTELFHDEANYWMFSQHMSWGFKDHPPAAPSMIAAGYWLIQNELGVRLFIIFSCTISLWLTWKIVRPQNEWLFFCFLTAMLVTNLGGFMAAPDAPLLLFTSLYFYFLKDYLEKDSWWTALAIAFALTGMAYSKYHGALILILSLLPNLRLLKRPSAWMIPLVTLLLFIPHLHWQWANDFASFRYHFQDRGEDQYEWTFITDFFAGQLALWGPLVSIPAFVAAIRFKGQTPFDRTMQWVFYGIFGFFFYQSFSQRTEANWTAVAFIPLVYLAYRYAEGNETFRKWVWRLSIASLVLVGVFRVYLVWDFLPKGVNPRNEFHGWDIWAQDISEIAGDMPVIFYNRFQKPVKYLFYSGKPAHCQTVLYDSGTQFDLLAESEEAEQGKTVLNIAEHSGQYAEMDTVVMLPGSGKEIGYRVVPDFRSYNRVRAEVKSEKKDLLPGVKVTLPVEIRNPTDKPVSFDSSGNRAVTLKYIIIQYEDVIALQNAVEKLPQWTLQPGETMQTNIEIKAPKIPGRYRYRLGFQVGDLYVGRNSRFYELHVKNE